MSIAAYTDDATKQLDELVQRIRREQQNRTPMEARRVTAAALRRWEGQRRHAFRAFNSLESRRT